MSRRMEKVNEEIKRSVMKIIQQELDDPRLDMVSITRVVTTSDLKESRVYFSVLKEENIAWAQESLNKTAGFIRKLLGKMIRIKILPDLKFYFDEGLRYSDHIFQKIEQVKRDEEDNSADKR